MDVGSAYCAVPVGLGADDDPGRDTEVAGDKGVRGGVLLVATDAVDPEQLARPRTWDLRSIRNFMITFGVLSTVFDLVTFLVLRAGFHAPASVFRTGWFIESTATELAVMLVLRTSRPFVRSRPSWALLGSSALIAAIALALPYIPALAGPLGLAPLPGTILLTLAALTAAYVVANEIVKRLRARHAGLAAAATGQ